MNDVLTLLLAGGKGHPTVFAVAFSRDGQYFAYAAGGLKAQRGVAADQRRANDPFDIGRDRPFGLDGAADGHAGLIGRELDRGGLKRRQVFPLEAFSTCRPIQARSPYNTRSQLVRRHR